MPKGHPPYTPNRGKPIEEIDPALPHMTQAGFAARFGFPVATLRHWEQGTRKPRGAAKVLLHVIRHNHVLVLRALEKPKY